MDYSIDEHVAVLVNSHWERAVIKKRLTGDRFRIAFLEYERAHSQLEMAVRKRELSHLSVLVCSACGNWVDPSALPRLEPIAGSRATVRLQVEAICYHDGLPFHMSRQPWYEVPGVTAVGGIRSAEEVKSE